jgi:DNA-binding FadR family transcriptional regulator
VAKRTKPIKSALCIHQTVAQQLGIAILSGVHKPGEHFSGEIEQSAALGISRTAYRKAIRILTTKGLLESRPKAGTHVNVHGQAGRTAH